MTEDEYRRLKILHSRQAAADEHSFCEGERQSAER
jgi:hypothetical protein